MNSYPTENPPEYAGVKEMRLRGQDVTNILGICAIDSEMTRIGNDPRARERLRLIPNGWRDFRLAQQAVGRLVEAVQWTIPMEKRVGFARTASRCKYVITQGPIASKPKEDTEEVIPVQWLDELVASSWDGRCRMCLDGNCARCELGKVLDQVVAKDRDGGSWSDIDIRRRDK